MSVQTTYKIIGSDGREYGPATLEELITWIEEGRVNGATYVWKSDVALWATADRLTEIQFEIGRLSPTPPPPPGPPTHPQHQQQAQIPAQQGIFPMRPVGFWPRVAAHLMDMMFIGLLAAITWDTVARIAGWENPLLNPTWAQDPVSFQAFQAYLQENQEKFNPFYRYINFLYLVYLVFFHGTFGATLGKMAIGAKVVRVTGAPLGYGFALLRTLAELFNNLTLGVGYLPVAFRKDKRGLHDLAAGTQVIYKR